MRNPENTFSGHRKAVTLQLTYGAVTLFTDLFLWPTVHKRARLHRKPEVLLRSVGSVSIGTPGLSPE